MQYPIYFKAAVLTELNTELAIQDLVFEGPLKFGQVLVKLSYSGICGKQLDEINGVHGEDKFLPHLLGHEGVGEVKDVGLGVKKVVAGDKVILHWMKGSGQESETPHYQSNGKKINAGWVTTFNEYAVISENRLTPFKGEEKPEYSLLGCAIPTALGMVFNDLNAKPYHKILIIGGGGVGLFVLQALKLSCVENVTVMDKSAAALELSEKLGADHVFLSDAENLKSDLLSLTDGKGFDKVILTTGNKAAIELGVELTRIPGETLLMGVPKHDEKISVNANAIMHKKNLIGNLGGSIVPERDIPAYMKLLQDQRINTDLLINRIYKFSDINTAIDVFKKGAPGRTIIQF
uniref:zinc-binding dehydrogenase n=1 Tax=Algoriphagus sp. TaxID=1872435 RepID=UPI004048325F